MGVRSLGFGQPFVGAQVAMLGAVICTLVVMVV